MGNMLVYEGTNEDFPGKVYIGKTDDLDREQEHQRKARSKLKDPSKLSPEEQEFYRFMEKVKLRARATGLDGDMAKYLEQRNIDIERDALGKRNVMNRINAVDPEKMPELERSIIERLRKAGSIFCRP
jgi:hypothetical protein